jgi:hypothetical protein
MPPPSSGPKQRDSSARLSPEEDSIGELDSAEDEIDDRLPADLWF